MLCKASAGQFTTSTQNSMQRSNACRRRLLNAPDMGRCHSQVKPSVSYKYLALAVCSQILMCSSVQDLQSPGLFRTQVIMFEDW